MESCFKKNCKATSELSINWLCLPWAGDREAVVYICIGLFSHGYIDIPETG